MGTKKTRTSTTTTTTIPAGIGTQRVGTKSPGLTWTEEVAVRMIHGLSEAGEFELEFRGRSEQTQAKLALMEAELLAQMYDAGPLAATPVEAGNVEVDQDLKARIVSRFSELNDD